MALSNHDWSNHLGTVSKSILKNFVFERSVYILERPVQIICEKFYHEYLNDRENFGVPKN